VRESPVRLGIASGTSDAAARRKLFFWGDLMTALLLQMADRPSAAEIARRARDTTTAFLQIYPEPD
jgi:hypothetical protein